MAGSDWKRVVATTLDAFDHVTIEPASPLDDAPPGSASIAEVVEASLRDPVDRPPLQDVVHGARHVTIVVPDGRVHVSEEAVATVLSFVRQHAPADVDIVALVACGWRPGPSGLEWVDVPQLAALARAGVPIAVHDPEQVVDVQVARTWWVADDDAPSTVTLNPLVVGADVVICLDRIELSVELGFTGGYANLAWGCGGNETMRQLEAICDRQGAQTDAPDPGDVKLHQAMEAMVAPVRAVFGVFEATSRDGRAFVSGDPLRATRLMAGRPGHGFTWVTEPFDAAIVLVDSIADASLLRATEPYALLTMQAAPPLRDDAPVLLAAACYEGVGCDMAGVAFARALRDPAGARDAADDPASTWGIRRAGHVRAALARHPLMLVAEQLDGALPDEVRCYGDLRDACRDLRAWLAEHVGEKARVLVTRDLRRSLPSSDDAAGQRGGDA